MKILLSKGLSLRAVGEAGKRTKRGQDAQRLRSSRCKSSSDAPGWAAEEVGRGRRAEIVCLAVERRQPPAQSSARRQFRQLPVCGGAVRPRESSLPEGLRESPAELSRSSPRGNQTPGGARTWASQCHPGSHLLAGATSSARPAVASALVWASGGERVNPRARGGARKGRKEIAIVLKVFPSSLFFPAEVSAGRRRH